MPFGGKLYSMLLSGERVKKALNANKQNQGQGSFLHFINVSQVNEEWLINRQAIDIKWLYKVVRTDFLLEKGDKSVDFLTFNNNPTIKRLDAPLIDVRKALLLIDKK
jgi:2',3'-cyclic-nucleotide 2'-phosphodiesterase (5'-nucleotidase family)